MSHLWLDLLLIDINHVELKYYPILITIVSLDQCTGSHNVLSPKICVPKEKKRHKPTVSYQFGLVVS